MLLLSLTFCASFPFWKQILSTLPLKPPYSPGFGQAVLPRRARFVSFGGDHNMNRTKSPKCICSRGLPFRHVFNTNPTFSGGMGLSLLGPSAHSRPLPTFDWYSPDFEQATELEFRISVLAGSPAAATSSAPSSSVLRASPGTASTECAAAAATARTSR